MGGKNKKNQPNLEHQNFILDFHKNYKDYFYYYADDGNKRLNISQLLL